MKNTNWSRSRSKLSAPRPSLSFQVRSPSFTTGSVAGSIKHNPATINFIPHAQSPIRGVPSSFSQLPVTKPAVIHPRVPPILTSGNCFPGSVIGRIAIVAISDHIGAAMTAFSTRNTTNHSTPQSQTIARNASHKDTADKAHVTISSRSARIR